ncbi:hypothetical protein VTI74DRAFT_8670 [Chaetomium olivicolor]
MADCKSLEPAGARRTRIEGFVQTGNCDETNHPNLPPFSPAACGVLHRGPVGHRRAPFDHSDSRPRPIDSRRHPIRERQDRNTPNQFVGDSRGRSFLVSGLWGRQASGSRLRGELQAILLSFAQMSIWLGVSCVIHLARQPEDQTLSWQFRNWRIWAEISSPSRSSDASQLVLGQWQGLIRGKKQGRSRRGRLSLPRKRRSHSRLLG